MDRSTIGSRPECAHTHSHQYTHHTYCYRDLEHLYTHRQPDWNCYFYPHRYADPYDHRDPVPTGNAHPFTHDNTEFYANIYTLSDTNLHRNAYTIIYALLHNYADRYRHSYRHTHSDDYWFFTATAVGVYSLFHAEYPSISKIFDIRSRAFRL